MTDTGLAEPRPARSPFYRLSLTFAATVVVPLWVTATAQEAAADEFVVGVVAGSDPEAAADFLEGFRLAVDQSPDVSHPTGTEGGDHLGAMDVTLAVATGSPGGDPATDGMASMIVDTEAPIVVADGDLDPDIVADVVDAVETSGGFLILVSDTIESSFTTAPQQFAANRQDLDHLLGDRDFTTAFTAAQGRPPSSPATRGYLAGRLVDLAVEATDRDPSDAPTMAAAWADVLDSGSIPGLDQVEPSEVVARGAETDGIPTWILFGAAGLALLAGGALVRSKLSPGPP